MSPDEAAEPVGGAVNVPPRGYLWVARHWVDTYVGGEVVDLYPVLEETGIYASDRPAETGVPFDHDVARREAQLVKQERPKLRVLAQRGCDCSGKGRRTPLAVAYARKGTVWVWTRRPLFPAAVVDEVLAQRQRHDKWWPAHREPSGNEHVEISTCRECRRHWAVMINERGFRMLRLDTPTFGSVVAPDDAVL